MIEEAIRERLERTESAFARSRRYRNADQVGERSSDLPTAAIDEDVTIYGDSNRNASSSAEVRDGRLDRARWNHEAAPMDNWLSVSADW